MNINAFDKVLFLNDSDLNSYNCKETDLLMDFDRRKVSLSDIETAALIIFMDRRYFPTKITILKNRYGECN